MVNIDGMSFYSNSEYVNIEIRRDLMDNIYFGCKGETIEERLEDAEMYIRDSLIENL